MANGKTKKKIGWADYFSSKYDQEKSFDKKNETVLGTFNYLESMDNRNDFQSKKKTMEKEQKTRLVEGENRKHFDPQTTTGRVLNASKSGQTAHEYLEKDPYYDETRLAQKKSRAKYTPSNIYNP